MVGESKSTTNHEVIRKWVEDRGGKPAVVEDTSILRIDFGGSDDNLKEISWDEFFENFDKNNLSFLYQEKTSDGSTSRFFKFVAR